MSTAQTEYSAPRSSSSRAYRGADSGATMTGMTDWMSRENTADAQVAELVDSAIAEELGYTRALTTTERQQVEQYLGDKYGIAVP